MKKQFKICFVSLIGILAACGGGGGGGSDDGGGSEGGGSSLQPLAYTGSTSQATLTAANAKRFFDLMFGTVGSDDITVFSTAVVASSAGSVKVESPFALGSRLRDDLERRRNRLNDSVRASAAVVNETEACIGGGSVALNGTVDDETGVGDLSVAYNDCVDVDGVTLSGQATFNIIAVNGPDITNLIIEIRLLRLRDGVTDVSTSGNISSFNDVFANFATDVVNTVTRDNGTGRVSKVEDLARSFSLSQQTLLVNGRVFDSIEGYVDVVTTDSLRFASSAESFPFDGGPLILTGAADTRLFITPVNASTVQVDVQDDGVVIAQAAFAWSQQQVVFLIPAADVSIAISDSEPVVTGSNFAYTLAVSNAGPGGASNLQVEQTLPPQVTFASASGTGWTCNHAAGVVTCSRAVLVSGLTSHIVVFVTAPASDASLSTTATVSATGQDPDSNNNTDTEQTLVGTT